MIEDIVPLVLSVVAKEKDGVTLEELIEESNCEKLEVLKAIHLLNNLKLIIKIEEEGEVLYKIVKELKAIDLAKAAQVGLNLSEFESYFKINKKEKKLALEISTQAEKIKNLDINNRKPLLQKREYLYINSSDAIYDNLLLLLEVTNNSLYEYLEILAEKDDYLKLLLNMHEQAESSLRSYSKDLIK